jgi:hypothetical protein
MIPSVSTSGSLDAVTARERRAVSASLSRLVSLDRSRSWAWAVGGTVCPPSGESPSGVRFHRPALRVNEARGACRRAGMRLQGPNCIGIANTDPSVRMDASFLPRAPVVGPMTAEPQSAALISTR